eukprot:365410-Chlamydomonas_euryale.AAC.6
MLSLGEAGRQGRVPQRKYGAVIWSDGLSCQRGHQFLQSVCGRAAAILCPSFTQQPPRTCLRVFAECVAGQLQSRDLQRFDTTNSQDLSEVLSECVTGQLQCCGLQRSCTTNSQDWGCTGLALSRVSETRHLNAAPHPNPEAWQRPWSWRIRSRRTTRVGARSFP